MASDLPIGTFLASASWWLPSETFAAMCSTLGDKGIAVYRQEVAKRSGSGEPNVDSSEARRSLYGGFPSFAAKYAAERLAIIDRDVDLLVRLRGGDLTLPHQFQAVAEAMIELDEPVEALAWARRGITETSGRQLAKLYDLSAELLTDADALDDVLELRRHHHERMPSASTYAKLQAAAGAVDRWPAEVDRAREALADRDQAGYIDALLADGDLDDAWAVAAAGDGQVHSSQWLRLAEARERTVPSDAMDVYLRLANDVLAQADKSAYRDAVRHLKAARRAASAAGKSQEFEEHLADLRERNRRRPSLMAMLDKAGLQ